MRRGGGWAILASLSLLICSLLFGATAARASDRSGKGERAPYDFHLSEDILIQAREIRYNAVSRVVEAEGSVEAARQRYILTADRLLYNEETDRLELFGNVQLRDGRGSVYFAEYVLFEDGLSNSFLRRPMVLWDRETRLAAAAADRVSGKKNRLKNAVYSPCHICPARGRTEPLWQITAARVVHDEENQTVTYWDAFLELFGIPVLYLPIFWHPSPDVERKTGLLIPSAGNSSARGLYFSQPFFWSITPRANLTFTPTYMRKRGVLLDFLYRQSIGEGAFDFWGTAIWPESDQRSFRGHLFSSGRFSLGDQARWGYDMRMTSDKSYLRLYGISGETELISRLFLEWTLPRHRFFLSSYYFQSLVRETEEDPQGTPFVGPLIDYTYEPPQDFWNGEWSFHLNYRTLTRENGVDSQRVSLGLSWERSEIWRFGSIVDFFAELRGDLYNFSGGEIDDRQQTRLLPLAGLSWRLAFFREGSAFNQIIEPVFHVIYSSSFGDDAIPNEDSPLPELDDTNIFSRNRFPGFDRWEDSLRLNAGVLYNIYAREGGGLSFLLGQSYRTRDSDLEQTAAGLGTGVSDFVARLELSLGDNLTLQHKFRADRRSLALHRNEINLNINSAWLSVFLGYADLDASFGPNLGSREEIYTGAVARFSDTWRFYGSLRRDIRNNRTIHYRAGLRYEDECFRMDFAYNANLTEDIGVDRDRGFSVRFSLRGLGSDRLLAPSRR